MKLLIALCCFATVFVSAAVLAQDDTLFPGDRASINPKDVDVNLPDGSPVKAGVRITKTWKIHNRGMVAWKDRELRIQGDPQGFKLVNSHPFSAASTTDVNVSVDLVAPKKPGNYRIYFKQWAKDKDGKWKLAFPGRYKDGVYLDVNVS